MLSRLEVSQFEEELEGWERSERTPRHVFRDLEEYPRYERIQQFPSCKIPCYHFLTGSDINGVHATYTKGDRIPQLLNTIFDLQINQCHNQAQIYDRIQLLSRYVVRKKALEPIPEDSVLPDLGSDLRTQIQSLKADLREIKASQTSLNLSVSEIRSAITEIANRESDPKPIEAETARVADQLQKQIKEVKAALAELKAIANSLIPAV
ncbi:hypothetical protein 1 [Green Sichuan pepper vein clearing-associated virus]|uniref:Uncharacterized protein n=1 Tax=Green Sichuan pepper vein clearing-associated virus TaxID=2802539 RepID=A0A513Q1C6_9VIRU|nr:hypothetical protein 1 [Green Sichuan pepper vein clearing-associated virus]QBB63965.1 hypothetical protein 1 [Green Sichuan pepper vein clearing-associated virus]